jgi:hypothetical protein
MKRSKSAFLFSIVTLVTATACGDATGPEDGTMLKLSLVTPAPPASSAPGLHSVVTQSDGSNTLEFTRVALVMREIELELASGNGCDDMGETDTDDDCEEFEAGPLLMELPLDGSVSHVVSIEIPAGTYDEIEFDIHKAELPEDQAFLDQFPEFEGVSIRVEGTWNGESFLFLQDLDEEQEIELSTPLVIEDGSDANNLTLEMDIATWYLDEGGTLIDPRTANESGENEGLVEDNIKQSIEAFEDDDEDGEDDDD